MGAVTGTAAGHPNIRATHAKTLELARDPEIGRRATCVVGVGAAIEEGALAALHGRVELVLDAGDESVRVRGRLNPAFHPGDPLVVRRAPAVTRDALIVDADVAAADLPRSFVAVLAEPGMRIAVRVEELVGEPAPGVLVVEPHPGEPVDGAAVASALDRGGRVTLTADLSADADARSAIAAAHAAGHTVLPAPGLEVEDALRAVAGVAAMGWSAFDAREERPQDVDWDDVGCAIVTGVKADRAHKWLRRAERAGAWCGAIAVDPGTRREQFLHWGPGKPIEIEGARGRTATLLVMVAGSVEVHPLEGRTAETSSVSRPEPRTSR